VAAILRTFEAPIVDASGEYQARVVGRHGPDHMWEGWLEFLPLSSSGDVLVSSVETTQPDREKLEYWAAGLTQVYVDGALARAHRPTVVRTQTVELPASDEPAPRIVSTPPRELPTLPDAVLDPFHVGARSLDILKQELTAFDRARLVNIINAYDLNPGGEDLTPLSNRQLITFIVTAVDVQMKVRR
jgi:hypothetical protein